MQGPHGELGLSSSKLVHCERLWEPLLEHSESVSRPAEMLHSD